MTPTRSMAAAVLLLAACSSQTNNAAEIGGRAAKSTSHAARTHGQSFDTSQATAVGSLKTELVGVATLDGAPVTDVKWASRCATIFVTSSRMAIIHWNKVGNFAGELNGSKATIPIDDGAGVHRFVMPNGAVFRRVNGSMGLLADDCGV